MGRTVVAAPERVRVRAQRASAGVLLTGLFSEAAIWLPQGQTSPSCLRAQDVALKNEEGKNCQIQAVQSFKEKIRFLEQQQQQKAPVWGPAAIIQRQRKRSPFSGGPAESPASPGRRARGKP